MFIFTLSIPNSIALKIFLRTLSREPPLVISLYRTGFKVSRLIFIFLLYFSKEIQNFLQEASH